MSYNGLFISSLHLHEDSLSEDSTAVKPMLTYQCPSCGGTFSPPLSMSRIANKDFDFNQQFMLLLPCCNVEVSLYLACHQTKNLNDLKLQLSQVPIEEDWYVYDALL